MANAPPTTPKQSILLSPDDFSSKAYIIEQPQRDERYVVVTLLPGLHMFRGDHEKKRPIPSGAVPVFFADAASAYIYTRGDGSKLSMFRVTNKPKLFVLSYKNLVKMFDDERLDEEEKLSLEAFLKPGSPPYIIPVDFLKREDAVAEHKLYLNRRILNIVCRLGFDGWIAFPDTLAQRNMDIPYYKVTGKMRFRLNPYNSEIAICHWATFLEAA